MFRPISSDPWCNTKALRVCRDFANNSPRTLTWATSHNVILSDEDFSTVPGLVEELFRTLHATRTSFSVLPVVVYRRYHEWILSLYLFAYTPKWYQAQQWNKWKNMTIPTFWDFPKEDHNRTSMRGYYSTLLCLVAYASTK
jgi:hypothetical protein